MSLLSFVINGERREADVDPSTPLLWVLRDHLGLVGTKYGCGRGLCGTCTVHLNGFPVRSCQLPAGAAAGSPITTIEGLHPEGKHPLQVAWAEKDVPQCGYCQSGQIMGAAALLARNPDPSDAEIDSAMSAHLCRCGTYNRIREGIHHAAAILASRPEEAR